MAEQEEERILLIQRRQMFGERGDILNEPTGLASVMDRILLGSHKHPVSVEMLLARTAEFPRADPPVSNTNSSFPLFAQPPASQQHLEGFFIIIIFASGMNPCLLSER